jgi:hypothetical protein
MEINRWVDVVGRSVGLTEAVLRQLSQASRPAGTAVIRGLERTLLYCK